MFGIGDWLKNLAAQGGLMAGAGALALLGVVWLSIALYTLLAEVMASAAAMAIVGGVALLPMLFMLTRKKGTEKEVAPARSVAEQVEPSGNQEATAFMRLAHSANLLAEKAPLGGVALTLGAAVIAARSPTTSPLAMHMLAEAVERWARPAGGPYPETQPATVHAPDTRA